MRKLKYIGNNKEKWERFLIKDKVYELYNTFKFSGYESVMNEINVLIKLNEERMKYFEVIQCEN